MKKDIYIYIYIKLNHFAVYLKLAQHCKSTILQLKNFSNLMMRIKVSTTVIKNKSHLSTTPYERKFSEDRKTVYLNHSILINTVGFSMSIARRCIC